MSFVAVRSLTVCEQLTPGRQYFWSGLLAATGSWTTVKE
jgi:hypothetical protein